MLNRQTPKTRMLVHQIILGFAILVVFSGMARRPMKEIEKSVSDRSGVEVTDLKRNPDKKAAEVDLSGDSLTLDTAMKIALTNNNEIQAVFQNLGIAKADVWQATLFKNPKFEGFVRFPNHEFLENGDPAQNNTEFTITQDFMDVLLMPFKRRVAAAEYKAEKLRVTDELLSFVMQVKKAYYAVQAAEQMTRLQKTVLEASEAALELGKRQAEAGNLKELDLAAERAAYEESRLEYEKILSEEKIIRESLNRLMGLSGNDASIWKIDSALKELPLNEPRLDDLEDRALMERFDLQAIREDTKALKRNLTATRLGIIPEVEVGVNTEKETDGGRLIGPTWNAEVPLWDQQLASGSKAKAQWRQNQFHESSYEVQVQSEVREAVTHFKMARTTVESYRDRIIPERERITGLYLKEYNYMLKGVYQLLEAKQKEIMARRSYIESLRDYWSSLAELERVVGGKLEFQEIKEEPVLDKKKDPAQTQTSSSADHSHHHGGHQS